MAVKVVDGKVAREGEGRCSICCRCFCCCFFSFCLSGDFLAAAAAAATSVVALIFPYVVPVSVV